MSLPAGYVGLLPILSDVAKKHGYALGLHGSLNRDMDLIAAPWAHIASDAETLVKDIAANIYIHRVDMIVCPEDKPHGRKAWCICLGIGAVIDISIMPRVEGKS